MLSIFAVAHGTTPLRNSVKKQPRKQAIRLLIVYMMEKRKCDQNECVLLWCAFLKRIHEFDMHLFKAITFQQNFVYPIRRFYNAKLEIEGEKFSFIFHFILRLTRFQNESSKMFRLYHDFQKIE